jgi:predicted secreted Zn-dependent protease
MSLELKTRQHINDGTQHITEVEKKLQNMDNTQTCNIQKEQVKMTKDMVQYQSNVKLMDH